MAATVNMLRGKKGKAFRPEQVFPQLRVEREDNPALNAAKWQAWAAFEAARQKFGMGKGQ